MNNDDIIELKDKVDELNHKIDSRQSDINTIKGFSKFMSFVICFLIGWKVNDMFKLIDF